MLTVEEALEIILGRTRRMPSERVRLLEALGSVLAEDVVSDTDLPPFDNSAVDGYAVRSVDTRAASAERPACLKLRESIVAGGSGDVEIGAGEASRVMTGAPIPAGADAVVMQEGVKVSGSAARVTGYARPGEHVRRAGEDVAHGSTVLAAGHEIHPASIAMLAATGHATVSAFRRPRVAVASTGDELVDVSTAAPLPRGRIRDSNRWALAALVEELGGRVVASVHLADDLPSTKDALQEFVTAGADVIITAGGVSVGDRDFVKPAIEALGSLDLWRVAIKPGKPLAFGAIGDTLVFGLPGNPASAMVTFEVFVRPALRKMAGRVNADLLRRRVRAVVSEPVSHDPGRREYVRAVTEYGAGKYTARPSGVQGSGMLQSMAEANSLMIIPETMEHVQEGAEVEVLLLA